jgi:fructosamine-3-kinase
MVESGDDRYFVKINRADRLWMFEAEAKGLTALAETSSVTVPAPACLGVSAGDAFLVLEYLPLRPSSTASAAALGAQLAALHSLQRPCFGFESDNAIGSTPQPNPRCDDWVEFFRRHRLEYQLGLSNEAGRGGATLQAKGARLCDRLAGFFAGYAPAPSLLHGDLWSGNYAALENGAPVIFDPAVYWGDREADLAMTQLFGGFPQSFYDAYAEHFPLDPGYRVRRTLYNLYHVLNHLNLFGAGYAGQAEDMLDRLLAELG